MAKKKEATWEDVKWRVPLKLALAAPKLLSKVKRVLAMHESKNNGAYNGEAVLSESVADELRSVIAEAGEK